VADAPKVGFGAGARVGLCEIEFVARCEFSGPSVRDSIEDKAVEEDKVARALDNFSGACGAGVWFELFL
jgi:hypothetical protein